MPIEELPLNACQFFQLQSNYVWQRIGFARKTNLRISETTITEELLYHFYQYVETFSVPIRVFESIEEYRNGSDLEILIAAGKGYILLACQAKISYKNGRYKSFFHKVGGKRQLDLLRAYALKHGGVGLYLLYNFLPSVLMCKEIEAIKNIEDQGITQVAADDIHDWIAGFDALKKKVKVPGFNEFHPKFATPLHELICELLKDSEAHLEKFPEGYYSKRKFYSEYEVRSDEAWRETTELATMVLQRRMMPKP